MDRVKIGFVGTGFMGQIAHLSNYALLDDCDVVALAEPRKDLARQVADRYGVKNVYSDHAELLEKCEVDAIVASQPFDRHAIIIPDILKAKKAVFTEKPLSVSVEAGEELVNLAKENNVLHMVGYHKRSDPAMEYAKQVIERWQEIGEFGKMRLVRITMPPGDWIAGASGFINTDEPYPAGDTESPINYFDEATQERYIEFVNYYIHQVNLMHFIFNEPYKVVFSDSSNVLFVAKSNRGICGTIEMAPYNTTVGWEESIFVGFEKGYVKVDLPAPLASQQGGSVTIMRDNGKGTPESIEPILPRVSAMRNQAKNFIAAVRGDKTASCTSKEALEDLKVAQDFIELSEKG